MFRFFKPASRLLPSAALIAALSAPAAAQERPDMIVVFDGSGSMWGQVAGRSKLELAREALSTVVSEVPGDSNIGMMLYGHRVRGQCSDIEMAVPVGPARQAVPAILARAQALNPRGMTPLVDSVLQAAQSLRHTERAATVVLLTDGIETCGGDPCALGRMLAEQGIDFTAHVVGFDLSLDEQRQVACLAHETGGMFLAANNAQELVAALSQAIAVAPEPEPQPVATVQPRNLRLILRDTEGGPVLTRRAFHAVELLPLDEGGEAPDLDLDWNPGALTGTGRVLPGAYTLLVQRETEGRNLIRVALPVEIPPGAGDHTLDLALAARLDLAVLLHAGQPMPDGNGRLPSARGQGWAEMAIHPVISGAIDPSVDYGGLNSRSVALPPGDYFIRGTLSQMFTRERLIRVAPGVTTSESFDFAAATVTVDLRDNQGFAVDRYDVSVFDGGSEVPLFRAAGRDQTRPLPLYLPEGTWRILAEGRGSRAEGLVRIDRAGQQIALDLRAGQRIDDAGMAQLMAEEGSGACLDTHAAQGCVVEAVTPAAVAAHLGLMGDAARAQEAVRYTGTWQTHGGMMVLVQEGRRVWGEVHVNGGIGLVWGHVAPDGLTLRGAMDRSSSPRGAMDLRLSPDGLRLAGRWDHNIGRMGDTVDARRLSGGIPPLTRATGTEDDLRLTMRGEPWPPADSADFAAFMAPARAAASPDTGEDIDAMQALAPPLGFTGEWATNHGVVTLHQSDRRVRGHYPRGVLEGEVSADGRELRGLWLYPNGDWGLFAFTLDPAGHGFAGRLGRNADLDLRGGDWRGERRGFLAAPAEGTPPALPPTLDPAAWDAFLAPVRGPDLSAPGEQPTRSEASPGGAPDLIPAGLDGFVPVIRQDFTHADGRLAVSVVFAQGGSNQYLPGYVWLVEGWCGPGCLSEILPVSGPDRDSVPNAYERLGSGGVFPALDLSAQGILAFESADTWNRPPALTVHELAGPYDEANQLRAGVVRSFGPFAGNSTVQNPDMSGWPVAPTVPAPVPVNAEPAIGAIDMLPDQGIFVTMADRPGEPLASAFARLFDPLDTAQAQRMADACLNEPVVAHPDGLIAERRLDSGGGYRTTRFQFCEQAGPLAFCQVYLRPLSANPGTPDFDYRAEVIEGPHGSFALRDLESGRAMLYRECRGSVGFLPELDRAEDGRLRVGLMQEREDQAALAPTPRPQTGQSPIPPGIWHAEAPWSDPMPAPGTQAFAARCYDEASVTWPDGQTIGFERQETAQGPIFNAIWAERCTPSGDLDWPFACRAEDANLSDEVGADPTQSRLRILSASDERVEMVVSSDYDPEPARFTLHACLRPEGGIDLTGDPRGQALARAIAEARPGVALDRRN